MNYSQCNKKTLTLKGVVDKASHEAGRYWKRMEKAGKRWKCLVACRRGPIYLLFHIVVFYLLLEYFLL